MKRTDMRTFLAVLAVGASMTAAGLCQGPPQPVQVFWHIYSNEYYAELLPAYAQRDQPIQVGVWAYLVADTGIACEFSLFRVETESGSVYENVSRTQQIGAKRTGTAIVLVPGYRSAKDLWPAIKTVGGQCLAASSPLSVTQSSQ